MVVVLGEEQAEKTKLIETIVKSKYWKQEKPPEEISDISGKCLVTLSRHSYTEVRYVKKKRSKKTEHFSNEF